MDIINCRRPSKQWFDSIAFVFDRGLVRINEIYKGAAVRGTSIQKRGVNFIDCRRPSRQWFDSIAFVFDGTFV